MHFLGHFGLICSKFYLAYFAFFGALRKLEKPAYSFLSRNAGDCIEGTGNSAWLKISTLTRLESQQEGGWAKHLLSFITLYKTFKTSFYWPHIHQDWVDGTSHILRFLSDNHISIISVWSKYVSFPGKKTVKWHLIIIILIFVLVWVILPFSSGKNICY